MEEQVTRTMPLYHFTSAKYALEAINMRRLKAAELDKTNDPYEVLAVELKSEEDVKQYVNLRYDLIDRLNAVCFSEDFKNPLLWSHYADKFHGICLGFEVKTYDYAYSSNVHQVRYKRSRVGFDDVGIDYVDGELIIVDSIKARNLILTKSQDWRYEEEWRIMAQSPLNQIQSPTIVLYHSLIN